MAELIDLRAQANTITNHHAIMAAGFGLVPVPWVDLATVSGVQVNMIRELANLYNVPFSKEIGRSVIAGVIGGGVPFLVSSLGVVGSTLKAVPFVGSYIGAAIMPGLSTLTTIALGRLFTSHFEAGGNLLNLDVKEMREHFRREFEKAKAETPVETTPAAAA